MRQCILAFLLFIPPAACKSDAEREREQRQQVHAKSSNAPPGTVRLTAEQMKTNDIQTIAAREEEISPNIVAIGRIKSRSGAESQAFAPFAGRILADAARIPHLGSEVHAGEVIADIEQIFAASERVQFKAASLQLQTEIDQARQEVDLRQKEFERARQLYDGGAIALKEFQTAESNLKQAQAKLAGTEHAKAEYDQVTAQQSEQRRTPIRAPISGMIVAMNLVPGEQVEPSKSLITILDTSTVWAESAVRGACLFSDLFVVGISRAYFCAARLCLNHFNCRLAVRGAHNNPRSFLGSSKTEKTDTGSRSRGRTREGGDCGSGAAIDRAVEDSISAGR